MNDLEKTIKHFESLQKRYTTQHNGKMCKRVADALEALNFYKMVADILFPPFVEVKSFDDVRSEIQTQNPTDQFDMIIDRLKHGEKPNQIKFVEGMAIKK